MRNNLTELIKGILIVALLIDITIASAQSSHSPMATEDFTLSVLNLTKPTDRIIEFDVYLLDTDGAQSFELAGMQLGFLLNSSIYSGGTLTASYTNIESGLNAAQQFTAATSVASTLSGYPNQTLIRLAGKVPPGVGSGTIISSVSPGTLITHFTLTSTVAWIANSTPSITFTSSSALTPLYASRVAQYIGTTGTYMTVTPGTNALVCCNPFLNAPVAPVWTGALTTNWATAGNWNPAAVPIVTDNVTIPNTTLKPLISGDITISGLTIDLNASVTVDYTATLTVTNTLTNNAGNVGLLIKSDASGTGSLKIDGAVTGTGTANVERYIAGYTDAIHGWHLLSSPVGTFNISGSSFAPGATDDLYSWNEPTDLWYNYKNGNPTQIEPGKGYMVAYASDATKTFTGSLNSADVSVSGLTSTTGASLHKGFNLLGNPFSSALNWTGPGWTKTNVSGTCQIWNETFASYTIVSDGNNIIPAMNGFMVYANPGGGSITIPKASQVHSSQAWYKNDQQDNDRIVLVARDPQGKTAQESVIRFKAGATEGYDNEFDSYFLCGYAPQFYSVAGAKSYALNTLPALTDNLAIPFSFIKNGSGSFSIELAQNLPGAVVYLVDKKTDAIQNLGENPVYNFTAADGDQPDRFLLRFGTAFLGVNPANASANFTVCYNQGEIRFSSMPEKVVSMSLIDRTGREIENFRKPGSDRVSLGKNPAPGYYLLRIRMTDNMVVKKLFIN